MPSDPLLLLSGVASLLGAAVAVPERAAEPDPAYPDTAPFRAELFSREELVEHARVLAARHEVAPQRERGRPLLGRVRENARTLLKTYQAIATAARRQEAITPAAEWLLDNFHIVEEQLEGIRKHLPRQYYGELPKLRSGPMAGYPRVYHLALELIAHSDGALDEQELADSIRAYQEVAPLAIGELWAVAIMLRVGLIENLRRLTEPLESQRRARVEADAWAERVMEAAASRPGDVAVILGELARRRAQINAPFIVRLVQRLRGRGPAVDPVLQWLNRHLAEMGAPDVEEQVRVQNQLQAADQVSISNSITSFRLLDTLDWEEFVESTSVVETVLRQDPAGVYAGMDFATRDACRHVVEGFARRCRRTEREVAEAALGLALRAKAEGGRRKGEGDGQSAEREGQSAKKEAGSPGAVPPSSSIPEPSETIAYYLIGQGARELERRLGYRVGLREGLYRAVLRHPDAVYLGGVTLLTLAGTALAVAYAARMGAGPGMLVLTALLALLPAGDLAVALVNRLLTLYLPPRVLPKLDYSEGIPDGCRTLVVIPALLTGEDHVDELLQRLEVHYLANQDANVRFALLTDFPDAEAEEMPGDVALLHEAIVGILSLNERHEGEGNYHRFFLLHRPREWNESQGCWMAWERKRGKLVELNRLLRGAEDTRYSVVIGDREALAGTRFVICLDTDTQLPSLAARRLVGTLAHPLNQPVVHPASRRVVEGYGILQPRVSISLPSASQSLFTRIFSGNAGVDPYTTAVSDVYQDLYGEGIFVGKGVYEVDTFQAVLEGRAPDNALLSHDLFEGSFARCALVTDIEVFDDYPARYNTFSARQHRWIRGDWQLLPWLSPSVSQADGRRERNPLSPIARWKILDNMRRSLTAPALILLAAAGWLVLPGSPLVWTMAALLVVLFPIFAHLASSLIVDPREVPLAIHFWGVWDDTLTGLKQAALTLTFLAHQAHSAVDAVCRTLWRLSVSRKKLLEWTSAAVAERRLGAHPASFLKRMWPAPAAALALGTAVILLKREAWPFAAPFLLAWGVSPVIAWWVSLSRAERPEHVSAAEREMLRLTARKTWRFFEEFVDAESHWLPPDNYQEDRVPPVAPRTSPTNIGLLLLSTLSARDLGYIGLIELTGRLEHTLWNVAGLERYRGHLYNWYETEGAKPIPPIYISTVDSGNLAGHLLALKQGCEDILDDPVFGLHVLDGLQDTAAALRESLGAPGSSARGEWEALDRALKGRPGSGPEWQAQINGIRQAAEALCAHLGSGVSGLGSGGKQSPVVSEQQPAVSGQSTNGASHTQTPPEAAPPPKPLHSPGQVSGAGTHPDTHTPVSPRPQTPDPRPGNEATYWCGRLLAQLDALQQDLDTLLPWARLLTSQPPPFGDGRPLLGADVQHRPHVFKELVTPPGRQTRGLIELAESMDRALAELARLDASLDSRPLPEAARGAARAWLAELRLALERCRDERIALLQRLRALIDLANRLVQEMDFTFLYDWKRDLFSVGYDVQGGRLDHYHYDLLASECRLASFIAIAKGEIPQKHWFRMGRALTGRREDRALVSWSGTMFEYMMPLLVMRAYEGTVLAQTLPAVVRAQQRFATRERVPWGISESGFNARDPAMNYQYRAFGVPGLGLKPDLFEDLVVSPYSTLLALPVAPKAAARNLEILAREGLACRYGFYEAMDYTPSRLQRGERGEVVRSLMAHHQGMSLVSLANYLLDNRMQARFHADPLVKSTELLLQERLPRAATAAHPYTQEFLQAQRVQRELPTPAHRHFDTAQTSTPRAQMLSNRRYSVMVTNAGGGASTWKDLAVTRWREDVTRDCWGMFLYLRDMRSGRVWSATQQPLEETAHEYEVYFTESKAEFQRRLDGIVSRLDIAVSPEDDVEVRRLSITNTTDAMRELEITSYAEVVIARAAADMAHVSFSNLFVETEFYPERTALLATRRPRSAGQARVWAVHVLAHEGAPAEIWDETEYETDRARFLGRGRTPASPVALEEDAPLSRSTGPVLDPIFCLRQRVRIPARATVQLAFTTGAAPSREEALRLAERYHDLRSSTRTFDLAWTHSQVELRHLNLSSDDANLCQRLASRVLYVDEFVRPSADTLSRNTLGQSGLWAFGISGDMPIVLTQVSSFDHMDLVRQLLVAHEYLRLRGLQFDLVILNEHPPSYVQSFEEALYATARNEGVTFDQPGGVFIRRAELIPDAGRQLLQFVARAVFCGDHGALADQLDWRPERKEPPLEFEASRVPRSGSPLPAPRPELLFPNGHGGFSTDGKEYVVVLGEEEWTPAPWINVIANERFGFLASEAGSGFTWSENSRENRLTPWSNDPVADSPGEVVYLRNEDTGRLWTVTPLPIREKNPFIIRHGPGYTRYEHASHGLTQELLVFTPPGDSIKIFRLRVHNVTDRVQRLSATLYAEWVLGVLREQTHPYVTTSVDSDTGALLARNTYNGEFAHRVAFADVNRPRRTWTADRTEFLGRNGSPRQPRALRRVDLGGLSGAGLDPCAAVQAKFTLQPGGMTEIDFTLGEGGDLEEVRSLVRKYREPREIEAAFKAVEALWGQALGTVHVRTPDPALDLLLNRWLLYQVLACRVWARSALYQSGGAYGFRDQLQDSMALVASRPDLTRAQLLLHAAHQFVEGDVQHWWHPPTGRGIRTRFSDDLLWLPYVTAYYVRATGDRSVLEEKIPFLHGRPLAPGEDEYYDLPTISEETAPLYEHCLRAIKKGLTAGRHGLPLMGTGDWNDGMNLVGNEGEGESVWVAWFLCTLLKDFAPLCEGWGERERAKELRAAAARIAGAVEENAWDGEWYRRAYFDDGTPLGSASNEECKIDAIAQSWAVISGSGNPERSRQAMEAVEKHLVREEDGLILLFTPPFDKSPLDPGYIKGYVPGVRENGGQYTHAALWTVLATALLGDGDRAHELFTLLNPIHHADTREKMERYRVEPYVVAADVYGAPPHTGRGGWTWYTGSASWMYRIGLETLLGFQLHGSAFGVDPCIPRAWPGFEMVYTRGTTRYRVRVENPEGMEHGVRSVFLDGKLLPDGRVPVAEDGREHEVRVVMGAADPGDGAGNGREQAPGARPAVAKTDPPLVDPPLVDPPLVDPPLVDPPLK